MHNGLCARLTLNELTFIDSEPPWAGERFDNIMQVPCEGWDTMPANIRYKHLYHPAGTTLLLISYDNNMSKVLLHDKLLEVETHLLRVFTDFIDVYQSLQALKS
jgi:hypothetical protein